MDEREKCGEVEQKKRRHHNGDTVLFMTMRPVDSLMES